MSKKNIKAGLLNLVIEFDNGQVERISTFIPYNVFLDIHDTIVKWEDKYLYTVNEHKELEKSKNNIKDKIKGNATPPHNSNKELSKKNSSK